MMAGVSGGLAPLDGQPLQWTTIAQLCIRYAAQCASAVTARVLALQQPSVLACAAAAAAAAAAAGSDGLRSISSGGRGGRASPPVRVPCCSRFRWNSNNTATERGIAHELGGTFDGHADGTGASISSEKEELLRRDYPRSNV